MNESQMTVNLKVSDKEEIKVNDHDSEMRMEDGVDEGEKKECCKEITLEIAYQNYLLESEKEDPPFLFSLQEYRDFVWVLAGGK